MTPHPTDLVRDPESDSAEIDFLSPNPTSAGALIGYARVSTKEQLLDRQIASLTHAGCIRIFADKKSGKNADREELRKAMLGRPPALSAEQIRHARLLLSQPDATVSSIARLLGVSRSTVYKYVPELKTSGEGLVVEGAVVGAELGG